MNEKIKAHLIAYAEKMGWETSDDDLMEIVSEGKELYRETIQHHRWYDDVFKVVDIDGMLIGFNDFYMTGDNSRRDMDLGYDLSAVCEVERKERVQVYYEPIKA